MDKKKIAFYIESFIVGGAEKVLIELVNNLDKEKYDITVITLFKYSVFTDYDAMFNDVFRSHIRYRFLINNSNRFLFKVFNYLYNKINTSEIYRFLVKDKYDIEVAFYEGWPTEFVSHSSQKSKKVAWLHTHQQRLYENHSSEQMLNESEKYKKFNQIIGVSKAVCNSFTDLFDIKNVQCLYNPLDDNKVLQKAEELIDLDLPADRLFLLTIGRIVPIKGFGRLIDALGKLKAEGLEVNLIMIGDGEMKDEIQSLVDTNHLSENVTLLGHLDNPYPYLKVADCLVCSSYQEGLSTVVIESNILGTPVLTTDCSGMDELMVNGETGIICENSEEGIYTALKSIINDDDILKRIRLNKSKLIDGYSLRSRMSKIERMFENLN